LDLFEMSAILASAVGWAATAIPATAIEVSNTGRRPTRSLMVASAGEKPNCITA
jgi:hypothetical protein